MLRVSVRVSSPGFLIYRSKSGIYHFLIKFEGGLVKWYMKVVYEIFDSFQLLSLISFVEQIAMWRWRRSTVTVYALPYGDSHRPSHVTYR